MNCIKAFHFALKQTGSKTPRRGLILHAADRWVEASPLPGWSREKLEHSARQLISARDSATLYPSVAFALSCFNHTPCAPFSLPLAALLSGAPDQIVSQAACALHEGYTCAKVKVGHLSQAEAKRVVDELLPHFSLRIDVNRAWETEEALSFFSHFPRDAFQCVEEPLRSVNDLSLFTHPFALDESVRERPDILKKPLPLLRALVIKPTLTGSVHTCLKWAQRAKERGAAVIISSAYESGVGTYHLARLAKRLQGADLAVGLGPYTLFEEDVLTEPLQIKQGRIYIPQTVAVNVSKIREIAHESELVSCGTNECTDTARPCARN